jgi:hypothetical protein
MDTASTLNGTCPDRPPLGRWERAAGRDVAGLMLVGDTYRGRLPGLLFA